jgi:hypothetical protein
MTTWNQWTGSPVDLDQCSNNKMYLRADPENPNTDGFWKEGYIEGPPFLHQFKITGSVGASGNLQYLLTADGSSLEVPYYGFACMFRDCTTLTSAPNLLATMLDIFCYYSMFAGCSSLTKAPELPATTLSRGNYSEMFRNCTSLTKAPELPATTLVENCYDYMFLDCSSLNSVNVNFSYWGYENTASWLDGVASEGTFTCPTALPDTPRDQHHIPSGWTRINKA